ncbi:hypothetical protein CAI21_04430 [Alkalilimnicola ehrlichii]|uniref:Uncharacterized protein n=1 Tax=Alkalilimnicola ehrlichii TaxID=351052 RepID=A0A3E0X1I8_9GAMM|nr:hypothetical protein [Alkalilimnicola ehrlichii]RFA30761.1 hypothetical protein CAI21_04430 [Alkalilimnicola ehrlichii]RFA38337.1 hypothetical protein CAL65_05795 [Alkalilimnicola ehrlichii]
MVVGGVFVGLIAFMVVFDIILVESGISYDAYLAIDMLLNLVGIGIAIFVGMRGNSWVEDNLRKKGYTDVGRLEAVNNDHAISEFVNQQGQSNSSVTQA